MRSWSTRTGRASGGRPAARPRSRPGRSSGAQARNALVIVGRDPAEWAAAGERRDLAGHTIFTVVAPALEEEVDEPLLVLHGFPTSSFDFAGCSTRWPHRRVLLFDFLGYGLRPSPTSATRSSYRPTSSWPSRVIGVDRLALLTHDMGDTVGGELLARQLEGRWPVEITRRVVTNGSIYIEMAHLTAVQQFLLALPDERLAQTPARRRVGRPRWPRPSARTRRSSAEELAGARRDDLLDGATACCRARSATSRSGAATRRRFTGAIETHPSPLAWCGAATIPSPWRDGRRAPRGATRCHRGARRRRALPDDRGAGALRGCGQARAVTSSA